MSLHIFKYMSTRLTISV